MDFDPSALFLPGLHVRRAGLSNLLKRREAGRADGRGESAGGGRRVGLPGCCWLFSATGRLRDQTAVDRRDSPAFRPTASGSRSPRRDGAGAASSDARGHCGGAFKLFAGWIAPVLHRRGRWALPDIPYRRRWLEPPESVGQRRQRIRRPLGPGASGIVRTAFFVGVPLARVVRLRAAILYSSVKGGHDE